MVFVLELHVFQVLANLQTYPHNSFNQEAILGSHPGYHFVRIERDHICTNAGHI